MIWIQDPRLQKKLLGPKVWSQDPRFEEKLLGSKIQDSRKNFLDPRSGSKIQDSRKNFLDPQQNLVSDLGKLCLRIQEVFSGILDLGSRPWIQEVFSVILDLGSWIQTLDPRSVFCNLGSWILDPDLGSKKFFLKSWIWDLGSRSWIQEVFPKILVLGSWIQINCYGSIVFINVYKRLQTCQNPITQTSDPLSRPRHAKHQPENDLLKRASQHLEKPDCNVFMTWSQYLEYNLLSRYIPKNCNNAKFHAKPVAHVSNLKTDFTFHVSNFQSYPRQVWWQVHHYRWLFQTS